MFFKLYGKQCITPVAIMTSSAKKNHERILSLCERLEWFGRGRSNFRLFEQVYNGKKMVYSKLVLVKLLFTEIYDCCCMLSFQISARSLLFQLLEQKMGNGLFVDNSCQYASLVVMV